MWRSVFWEIAFWRILWGLGAMTGQGGRNFAPQLREQDAVISGKIEDYFQTPKPKTGPAKGSTNKKRGRPPKKDKDILSGSTSEPVATLDDDDIPR